MSAAIAANTISSSNSGGVANAISTQQSIVAAAEFYIIQRTGISRKATTSSTYTYASCDKSNASRTRSRKKYRVRDRDRARVRWRSACASSINCVRSSCVSKRVNELSVAGGNEEYVERRTKRYERKIGARLRFVGDATFCGRSVSTLKFIENHIIILLYIYTSKNLSNIGYKEV